MSDEGIITIATSYFDDLFQSCGSCHLEEIGDGMEIRVNEADNQELTAPVTDAEIEATVFQIPPTRAPGPDGFSGCFYQDHWNTVGADVIQIIKAF